MNRQQDERENPRTNADSSPSQHQTTLQQQTDEYTLTTAQRNNGVRQHRSSQSYLPLEPLSTSAINTNAATGRGATVENRHSKRIQCTPTTIIHALGNISNNLQMIPTAILPTKCPSESSITNTSTGDNTKGKDTHPYTRITEANNSQTADVSCGCPLDSNVQVSPPHPATVSSASRDPETTHGVPVLTSRVKTRYTAAGYAEEVKGTEQLMRDDSTRTPKWRKNKNGGASEKGKKQGSLDSYISDKNTSDSSTRSQPNLAVQLTVEHCEDEKVLAQDLHVAGKDKDKQMEAVKDKHYPSVLTDNRASHLQVIEPETDPCVVHAKAHEDAHDQVCLAVPPVVVGDVQTDTRSTTSISVLRSDQDIQFGLKVNFKTQVEPRDGAYEPESTVEALEDVCIESLVLEPPEATSPASIVEKVDLSLPAPLNDEQQKTPLDVKELCPESLDTMQACVEASRKWSSL
ncbi:hypothetical protein C0Q70_17627 [Pomacea canaliculata]|uniref:Uncharacterized protein n=1 Tax=Pomacea canaliculata TaxID=400727 RepID=A0A2T7NKY7_POMCA|nr:hypothetical protein C0Q70_17627 [Pomacea canaliculata]